MVKWYKAERSNEERREIYQKLRKVGVNPYWARRLRDWSYSKIKQFLDTNGFDSSEFNGKGGKSEDQSN